MERRVLMEKPTFQYIRQQAKTRQGKPVTPQDIAKLAGLSLADVYVIEIGGYSSEEKIGVVLRVFNALTGQRLARDDIRAQRGGQ